MFKDVKNKTIIITATKMITKKEIIVLSKIVRKGCVLRHRAMILFLHLMLDTEYFEVIKRNKQQLTLRILYQVKTQKVL